MTPIQCELLSQKLDLFVVFRNLPEHPVLYHYRQVLNDLALGNGAEVLQHYADFIAALYERGDVFSRVLLDLAAEDENPYVKLRARREAVPAYYADCVKAELQTLSEVADVPFDELHALMASAVPESRRFAVPPYKSERFDFAGAYEQRIADISKTGYGMGKKDFERANCVRIMIGESDEGTAEGKVAELCCNVDDMTGEEIGYATELLMKQGALDVFTTPVGMKKNRPGILITCICRPEDKEKFAKLVFENTTTIGIRYSLKDRYVLDRHEETVSTKYGDVKVKISEGFGVKKAKPGYDDVSGIADKI